MKIVFMGTPEFAVPSLDAIHSSHHEVVSVVTAPDKPKGRGQKFSQSAVKEYASKNNITVLQPEKLKSPELIDELKKLNPDLIVVVAFKILPEEVFSLPKFGSINLHASLLPKYRGAAPINHAIMNGETETGVTTFFLDKKVDTGYIILQKKIAIFEDDNATTIHDKMKILGADAVIETLDMIENKSYQLTKQDNSLASPAPKIFKEDCKIDWTQNVESIHNQIRGLSLYPAAFTTLNGKNVKIFRSKISGETANSQPGTILIKDKKLFVSTSDKLIEILELQLEGKTKVNSSDFINGLQNKSILFFT